MSPLFRRVAHLLCLLLVVALPRSAGAQKTVVAAASDLSFALTEISERFTKETGQQVELVFGSSGTLTRQIQEGAPFDLFLSADESFVEQLASAGLTRDGGALYAIGRIVLFAPTGSPMRPDEGLAGLRSPAGGREGHPLRHRQSAARALWTRGRGGTPQGGTLGGPPAATRARRQRLASRAVRHDRRCGRRHHRAFASPSRRHWRLVGRTC